MSYTTTSHFLATLLYLFSGIMLIGCCCWQNLLWSLLMVIIMVYYHMATFFLIHILSHMC